MLPVCCRLIGPGIFRRLGKGAQGHCCRVSGETAGPQEAPLALLPGPVGGRFCKALFQNCQSAVAFVMIGIVAEDGCRSFGRGFWIDAPEGKFAHDARPAPFAGPGAGKTLRKAQIGLQALRCQLRDQFFRLLSGQAAPCQFGSQFDGGVFALGQQRYRALARINRLCLQGFLPQPCRRLLF